MKKILFLLLLISTFVCTTFCESINSNSIISNKAEAAVYNQVQAFHILVPTESEAIVIREEIVKGKDNREVFNNFVEAAKKYSKCPSGASGGALGWFGRGDMVPAFEKAAFNAPKFEVTEPVKTSFGWHLILVVDKK